MYNESPASTGGNQKFYFPDNFMPTKVNDVILGSNDQCVGMDDVTNNMILSSCHYGTQTITAVFRVAPYSRSLT